MRFVYRAQQEAATAVLCASDGGLHAPASAAPLGEGSRFFYSSDVKLLLCFIDTQGQSEQKGAKRFGSDG